MSLHLVKGQTTIEPCEFCGEPSVEHVVLAPPVYESQQGVKTLKKRAVKAHVCAGHRDSVDRDVGWQERAAAARKQARAELKAAQEEQQLFDPGPAVKKRKSYEDV